MRSIDEVVSQAQAESTKVDSIVAAFAALKQQLADVLSGVTLPPAVQAKIDALFDINAADATKIDTALSTQPGGAPAG